ncbi:MAG TPA: VOC family protein [Mucilaginibacter sp.]|nr:VOC family protein [Mucilaginibacter sp.]
MLSLKPHLWFNQNDVKEAAEFYTGLLPDSAITVIGAFQNGPSGVCNVIEFTVAGQPFLGLGAGGSLEFTPAISFMINFDPSHDPDAADRIDEVWEKLSDGGKVMMPLDRYPFSERYGWVSDKYGLSWQLILTNPDGEERPTIVPSMMFTGEVAGSAEQAIDFYCGIFKDSKRGITARYPAGAAPDKEGTLMFADFNIDGAWMAAMDSAHPHGFYFNDAISMLISCDTQEEIDYYWSALSAGGQGGHCGWLKDKFGVSWQVTSTVIFDAIKNGDPDQIARVISAFMPMTRIDITMLKSAYNGD